MVRKMIVSTLGAAALIGATLVGTATTAGAAAASEGDCSTSRGSATGRVVYSTSGGRHNISAYTWTIRGQSGSTQNDVRAQLRRHRAGLPDSTVHSFSTGNAHNGNGSYNFSASYPSSYTLFGQIEFIFDINNATDPRCTAYTSRF
jgi:hypothetical protein